jgi:cell division transport system permease protein
MFIEDKNHGTRFVTLVIVMMTILATITMGGALIIQALRGTWVDAVAGNITIEIPASDGAGLVRDNENLMQIAQKIKTEIQKIPSIQYVHILSNADVKKLVEPWLGADAGTDDLPLPALIGVTLKNDHDAKTANVIADIVKNTDAASTTETHAAWLADLRRFSLVLLLAAVGMATATIACCIISVAGAVRSRLSEHHSDIDLLHLMGATDSYIAKQFVEIIVRYVGQAALIGTAIGFTLLKAGSMVAGGLQSAALPQIHSDWTDYLWFAALPSLITLLCFVTARVTVLRSLQQMS